LWLSGYYNGERHNTIIEPQAIKSMMTRLTYSASTTAIRP
jgi:hypothetical protein